MWNDVVNDVISPFREEIRKECRNAIIWAKDYLTPTGAVKIKFTPHLVAALVYIYEFANYRPIDVGDMLCQAAGRYKKVEARRLNKAYRFTGSTLYKMIAGWAIADSYPLIFSVSMICNQYEFFHQAAYLEDVNLLKWLLDNGVNVEMKDLYGRTALHLAAIHSLYQIVDELIARGASFFAKDGAGKTPFEIALSLENFQIADFLKPTSFCNKILDNGETLFFSAIRKGNEKQFKYLAKYADYSLLNPSGQSVLHVAAWTGNVTAIMTVLPYDHKGELLNLCDIFGQSPLYKAVVGINIPAIDLLLLAGAQITPDVINVAKKGGIAEIIELMKLYTEYRENQPDSAPYSLF